MQGKIEGTIWAGAPADLIAAAAQLIDNEEEFERLFLQVCGKVGWVIRSRVELPSIPN